MRNSWIHSRLNDYVSLSTACSNFSRYNARAVICYDVMWSVLACSSSTMTFEVKRLWSFLADFRYSPISFLEPTRIIAHAIKIIGATSISSGNLRNLCTRISVISMFDELSLIELWIRHMDSQSSELALKSAYGTAHDICAMSKVDE